jgi:transposase
MAGTFDGLSDLEWKLVADVLPPAPPTQGVGMPHTPWRKVVNTLLDVLITGCRWCDLPRGPQGASKSAAQRWLQRWQAGWHPRGGASPPARAGRRAGDASVARRRRGWLFFPLAKAAVRALRMAGRAKASASTASQRVRACRCPRAPRLPMAPSGPKSSRGWQPGASARAHEADRAHGSRSWRRRKGRMPKTSAGDSESAGSELRSLNGCGRSASRVGGPSKRTSRASKPSGRLPGSNASTAAWSCAGNVSLPASTRSSPSP